MAISDGSSDGCSSELLGPVLDDAEVARMLEETVDVVDDDEVQVEQQRRPFETAEAGREGAELAPGPVLYRFRQRDVGHRQALASGHIGRDACREGVCPNGMNMGVEVLIKTKQT